MTKNRGYAMMSGFLGAFLIATGMFLKNFFLNDLKKQVCQGLSSNLQR